MEAAKFIKQKARMCDYYSGRTCTHDESGETCPAMNIECEITTDELEQLVAIVEKWAKEHPEETGQERQKPEREQQKPEHPEESSDLHAIIDALEDRIDKLDDKVSYEALQFRARIKQNQDAHRHLTDRIAALEKDPVESMNEPKRTNKDVIAHFPKGGELTLNVNKICAVYPTVNNTGCAIECEGGRTFCVKESYENVQKMIGVYQNDEMPHL